MYRYTFYAGIVFQITILFAANHLCFVNTDTNNENNYTNFIDAGDYAIVKICEPLSEKEKSVSAQVEFYFFRTNMDWTACSGNAIIYFRKNVHSLQLHYGDFIIVKNNFARVTASKNPDEFNYQRFLEYKNIYATSFIDSSQFSSLHFSKKNPVWQLTFWLRQKSIDAFAKYISLDRERAVADALVIGDRDNMSFALMQSYSSTGVIHVLAVSGLHVAILYALLELLTSFIRKRKHGKFYQAIIILIIIWIFALVTGLSGSVTRAATMFTFITVGKTFRRSINIFNILASSSLVILLFNPYLIMDVGFQLSYVAVIGITTLYSSIDAWFLRENKIIDKAWKLSSVSLSAQTATVPLTSFYFNQFPVYFLLANLLVIPLSGIILQLGLALVVFQSIPVVAPLLGKLLTAGIYIMDEYIVAIQHLPFAVIHFPRISILVTLLLAAFFICITNFFLSRKKTWLFASLFALLFATAIESATFINDQSSSIITVYNFRGKTCIEFKENENSVAVVAGKEFTEEENYYLQKHRQLRSTSLIESHSLNSESDETLLLNKNVLIEKNQFIQFKNYKMVVLQNSLKPNQSGRKIKVDAVIISGNPKIKIKNVLSNYETKQLIFDASNSKGKIKYWKKDAAAFGVACYSTDESGAFIKQL